MNLLQFLIACFIAFGPGLLATISLLSDKRKRQPIETGEATIVPAAAILREQPAMIAQQLLITQRITLPLPLRSQAA
jgi:hypothetical protein